MTIEKIMRETARTFSKCGFEQAQREAEQLVGLVLGKEWGEVLLNKQEDFPIDKLELLSDCVSRRKQGEPLAYIEGIKHFYKYDFYVSPAVLIPRPESEIIIEEAVNICADRKIKTIFDIGCGSGCLGLSLAKEFPEAEVHLFDVSQSAIEIAKKNRESLGLTKRAHFYLGEVSETPKILLELKDSVDIVVANPPYIDVHDDRLHSSVLDFEPNQALFAGANGLEWIEKWMLLSEFYLKPQALGIFEYGQGQTSNVRKALDKTSMKFEKTLKDYAQIERHIVFTKE